MILLKEQFKGLIRKNLRTRRAHSELCDQGNVFLQRDRKNTSRQLVKRKASVETPAGENFSYDNHFT
jgi:hypothetical protein